MTDKRTRDPAAKKSRDLKRQRKIASNSSDKAARRNAPRIKAMANRKIRRTDKQALDTETEANADQINLDHQRKAQHWGSDNAAERRARQAKAQARYQAAGGRLEVQREEWEAVRHRIDNKQVVATINAALAERAARKAKKQK